MATQIKIENLVLQDIRSKKNILNALCLEIPGNQVTALIGPSGSGKTSLLKCINRMIDLEVSLTMKGVITSNGRIISDPTIDIYEIRRKFAMVYALPIPLPKTIFENIALAARLAGVRGKDNIQQLVEKTLVDVGLWDEVKERLNEFAFKLSGGQQQRLCIARALALNPEVLMFDEATSGLDPISTGQIEETLSALKEKTTVIWVTNNVKQAARVSDYSAFLLMGELIEFNKTPCLFTSPQNKKTDDYISGKFG